MLVLVKQPNSVILEVEVSEKADGLECLEKVCKKLGIIEVDYFGLEFVCNKGERLWLNLRNSIERQLPGSPPYRLQLRVKFYIEPHYIQQSTTREQFYLNVKQDFIENRLRFISDEEKAKIPLIAGLLAQAELGDHIEKNATQILQYENLIQVGEDMTEFLPKMVAEHVSAKGLSCDAACYKVLQEVGSLGCYGMEYHETLGDKGALNYQGVGPKGIATYDAEWQLLESMIDYQTIHKATVNGKILSLHLITDAGETTVEDLRLSTPRAANALYRSVTEMYSFYRCDTVRNVVASQFSFDIKGALVSIFNENTSLGKKYVFDIRRTFREAYDHARRVLYALEHTIGGENVCHSSPEDKPVKEPANMEMASDQHPTSDKCAADGCIALKDTIEKIQDSFTCQCCADNPINTVFIPCGHLVCCSECSARVTNCPLCRSDIKQSQLIFLPSLSVLCRPDSMESQTNNSGLVSASH